MPPYVEPSWVLIYFNSFIVIAVGLTQYHLSVEIFANVTCFTQSVLVLFYSVHRQRDVLSHLPLWRFV